MIFLAFLLPLGAYFLYLGALHRRPRPIMISGTWDLIGLLFASSGFLLFTGPAIVAALAERSYMLWSPRGIAGGEAVQRVGIGLSVLYFVGVLTAVVILFQKRRGWTAVYNIEPEALEKTLATACAALGLQPTRSGNLYVFGATPVDASPWTVSGAMQRPGPVTTPRAADGESLRPGVEPVNDLLGQSALLETEVFPAMRHVTLRWEPGDSLVRQEVESELERLLSETVTPPSDLGGLLSLAGFGTLVLTLVAALVLVALRLLGR